MSRRAILAHGAWGRASVWDRVSARLVALGWRVEAIDLPGHGGDATPTRAVTLERYAERIAAQLDDGAEPAVLVGHSMGGMAISAAAELRPERVRKLVYVCAFLPADGQSLVDLLALAPAPGIRPAIRPGPAPGATTLDPAIAAAFLCQDATPAEQAALVATLGPQANAAQTDKARLTADRFGAVPRAYVFCERDLTVSPALQRRMVAASPCAETASIDCGHMPQITASARLADILDGW